MKIGPDLPCGQQRHCIPAVQKVPNTLYRQNRLLQRVEPSWSLFDESGKRRKYQINPMIFRAPAVSPERLARWQHSPGWGAHQASWVAWESSRIDRPGQGTDRTAGHFYLFFPRGMRWLKISAHKICYLFISLYRCTENILVQTRKFDILLRIYSIVYA